MAGSTAHFCGQEMACGMALGVRPLTSTSKGP